MEFTARQIAGFVGGEVEGDENASVCRFSKIEEGEPGSLSFLSNPKYTKYIYETRASVVIVAKTFVPERKIVPTLVKVDDPYDSFARLLAVYEASKPKKEGIDSLAWVSPSAKIGKGVYIGPFAYVGDGADIGDGVRIFPHSYIGDNVIIGGGTTLHPHAVVLDGCRIGRNCTLHPGAVVGADGFGFAPTEAGYDKIPQIGSVVIEDNVDIGANTCVDRATMGATVVKKGTKLDNLVQVAHNVEVGENTVIAAQTGIAGSSKVGQWCKLGGQVGIAGHITVGDRVNAGAQAGIPSSIEAGRTVIGTPAVNYMDFFKIAVMQKRLPQMFNTIEQLKEELRSLKESLNK